MSTSETTIKVALEKLSLDPRKKLILYGPGASGKSVLREAILKYRPPLGERVFTTNQKVEGVSISVGEHPGTLTLDDGCITLAILEVSSTVLYASKLAQAIAEKNYEQVLNYAAPCLEALGLESNERLVIIRETLEQIKQ
jgi:hypothetical protein